MLIISINAGSSSLKFKLYNMPRGTVICGGLFERIDLESGIFTLKINGTKEEKHLQVPSHGFALQMLLDTLISKKIIKSYHDIKAAGHRVVQGGSLFKRSAPITTTSKAQVASLIPLAPLHNEPELNCATAFEAILPNLFQVFVFDTSFHQTMEEADYLFPIPYDLAMKHQLRRYGAHGTSHQYLAKIVEQKIIRNKKSYKLISCHIGSGASICAIKDGKSIATSMGLTPLGGIMMGTRSGDMDPSVYYYLQKLEGLTNEATFQLLNRKSGLAGVSMLSSDSRDVLEAEARGDKNAIIADELFVRRSADFISQYYGRLGGADVIVFSAGIGENSPEYRERVVRSLEEAYKLDIDLELNKKTRGTFMKLSTPKSKVKIYVIPTDEELMIAKDAYQLYQEQQNEPK